MAYLTLNRPAAGARALVQNVPGARVILDFPADHATLERSGDSLVFKFENGASIELQNFYTDGATIPDFEVDGAVVAGMELFAALGALDILPAAGPDAGGGGHYNEWGVAALASGLDHLGGLGFGLDGAGMVTDKEWDVTALADAPVRPDRPDRPNAPDAGFDDNAVADAVPPRGGYNPPPVNPDENHQIDAGEGGGRSYNPTPVIPGEKPLSNWNRLEADGTGENTREVGFWTPSDPADQGWHNYLFDKVYNSNDLYAHGDGGQTIDLPRMPAVKGAGNAYLYMKDCGEFDADATSYDLDYLQYAFGMPAGLRGADARAYVDNILQKKVGISVNNEDDLHAYNNDYDWNLVSRSFSSGGGEVNFGWAFQGGDDRYGDDACFWMLKDQNGRIIDGGVLARGAAQASGTANIVLPSSVTDQEYTLTIGQMNVGKYDGNQGAGNPHMLIGDVVLTDYPGYRGDALADPSDRLASVTFDKNTYYFSENNPLKIATDQGTMTINPDGRYFFEPARGVDANDVLKEFDLTSRKSPGESSTLYLGNYPADGNVEFGTGRAALSGDADEDMLFGGAGNGVLVFNPGGLADDGAGIDILLVDDARSLDELFDQGAASKVNDVEMILSGSDVMDLRDLNALRDIGITLNSDGIRLGSGWHATQAIQDGYQAWTNDRQTVHVAEDEQASLQVAVELQA